MEFEEHVSLQIPSLNDNHQLTYPSAKVRKFVLKRKCLQDVYLCAMFVLWLIPKNQSEAKGKFIMVMHAMTSAMIYITGN